jgi:membrane fusion protein (multidrug efflux system)
MSTAPATETTPARPEASHIATAAAEPTKAPPSSRPRWGRRIVLIALGLVAIGLALYYGIPFARTALTTVSTDDAYVSGHVTYVAPRISETVERVLVDDNDHVVKGDLLVVLDKDVERIQVEQAEAALNIARRTETQQIAQSRALSALAKANHFKLESAMTEVRNMAASLSGAVARLEESRAAERLAQIEFSRFAEAGRRGAETAENVDIRRSELTQAQARTRQAEEEVRRLRLALELPADPPKGEKLDSVPPDQDQKHSTVIAALSTFAQNLADLGLDLPRYHETPTHYIQRIHDLAPNGDLDALIEQTSANAPAVESARAQVQRAIKDLDRARLDLSYCEIRADIDGYISNRNVNPGNRVVAGQRLMAIRSDRDIWIDANFKETQLDPIRIGQPVDFSLDAYPGKAFRGRVSGFSPGTGQSLALLPAQNATGNFVKIVQRLPVRIDLIGENPQDTPLFIGLSVVPYVRINDPPEGPNAGQRLRQRMTTGTGRAERRPPAPESRPTFPPTESRVAPERTGTP